MRIGEMDIPANMLYLEHRVRVLEKMLLHLFNVIPDHGMTQEHILAFQKQAAEEVKAKYPSMGVVWKPPE